MEIAVSMLQEPGHHLFNTYRKKGRPGNIRVKSPIEANCLDTDCILPMMKKLLKKGKCSKIGCSISDNNLIYRHEQKLIDTMLTCDLIYVAQSGVDKVILISGDDDFLPPLRTVLLQGQAVIRFHPKPHGNRAKFPIGGVKLLEMEL